MRVAMIAGLLLLPVSDTQSQQRHAYTAGTSEDVRFTVREADLEPDSVWSIALRDSGAGTQMLRIDCVAKHPGSGFSYNFKVELFITTPVLPQVVDLPAPGLLLLDNFLVRLDAGVMQAREGKLVDMAGNPTIQAGAYEEWQPWLRSLRPGRTIRFIFKDRLGEDHVVAWTTEAGVLGQYIDRMERQCPHAFGRDGARR